MKEITKEQYEAIQNDPNKRYKAFELGLVSESELRGYGIRWIEVKEIDGKYYLDYACWDSCE